MSMISSYDIDSSDSLYRRYAILASSYLDEPKAERPASAEIPLENLFRLLEMYRFNAFSDESRSGVLDLENYEPYPTEEGWYKNVVRALDLARSEAFNAIPKGDAITELEDALRQIATNGDLSSQKQSRAKRFFLKFVDETA